MTVNLDQLTKLLESYPGVELSGDFYTRLDKKVQDTNAVAHLSTCLGNVFIQRKGVEEKELATSGTSLFAGDIIQTLADGRCYVIFKDDTQIWMNRNTELEINPAHRNVFIAIGQVLAFVTKRPRESGSFVVGTPAGLVEVLGTEFDTTVTAEKNTIVTVLKGLVRLKNEKGEATLKKSSQSQAMPDKKPSLPVKVDTARMTGWTNDLANRSIQERRIIPPSLQSDKDRKPRQTVSPWLAIILILAACILGYVLGYFWGLF